MRGGTDSRGYTIVEVMVFLAVSGLMFLIAASFVNGKQAKAQFRQSMNDMNTQVQRVVNDVNNGYYPATENYSCSADSVGGLPQLSSTAKTQGVNKGCVFLGKVIQFGVSDTGGHGYNVYSIAGRQYATTADAATLPTSFSQSKPVPISDTINTPPHFDVTERNTLQGGASVTKVLSKTASGWTPINAIGFFNSFGSYDGGGTLQSGSQSVSVVVIPGTSATLNETANHMVDEIKSQTTDANVVSNPNIMICVDSGSGQYGVLSIGGASGQRLTSSFQISSAVSGDCAA